MDPTSRDASGSGSRKRARPANVSEILAHMVLGDRISEGTMISSEPQDSSRVSWTSQDVDACAVKWMLESRPKS